MKAEKCLAGTFLPSWVLSAPSHPGRGSGGWDKGLCVDGCPWQGRVFSLGSVGLGILCLRGHLPWCSISHAGYSQHVLFFSCPWLLNPQPPSILPPSLHRPLSRHKFYQWESNPQATGPVLHESFPFLWPPRPARPGRFDLADAVL